MIRWDFETALMRANVGDSFFIPTLNPTGLRIEIYAAARRLGAAVICKCTRQDGVLGVRTWRVIHEETVDDNAEPP